MRPIVVDGKYVKPRRYEYVMPDGTTKYIVNRKTGRSALELRAPDSWDVLKERINPVPLGRFGR